MTLQGLLMRNFAHKFPLSFDCSVTFEQMYGGIEGDSASMAEYIAIVSELADVPIRQDLAITGSVNQLGEAQVIGGVHHKIEGFFAACQSLGRADRHPGRHAAAAERSESGVARRGPRRGRRRARFTYTAWRGSRKRSSCSPACRPGEMDAAGDYPPESVYGRVMATPDPLRHDADSAPHLIHRFRGSWRAPLKINGFGRLPRLLRCKTKAPDRRSVLDRFRISRGLLMDRIRRMPMVIGASSG